MNFSAKIQIFRDFFEKKICSDVKSFKNEFDHNTVTFNIDFHIAPKKVVIPDEDYRKYKK